VEPELNLPLPAVIPEDYVPGIEDRLGFYQRFSQARSVEEVFDLVTELGERYGRPPPEIAALSELMQIKVIARRLGISRLEAGPGKIGLVLHERSVILPEKLVEFISYSEDEVKITPEMQLKIKFDARKIDAIQRVRDLLHELEACATSNRD
jgi:transcription-repair coupling factor (superfamily II helicase)